MFNLVFSSKAFRPLTHDDLFLLLSQSRKNNRSLNISGMLLYNHNRFIQTMEGERDVVVNLYSKIRNDMRHKEVKIELENEIEERLFSDWSMSFFDADETEKYNIPGFSRFLENDFGVDPLYKSENHALDLLLDFKQSALANL